MPTPNPHSCVPTSPLGPPPQRPAAPPRAALLPLSSSLQPAAASHYLRHGISLLEVLIAMFVMLFGLMGVAAIFPVGNHYAGRGDRYDRGAALSGSAFAELKSRGMLQPQSWVYPTHTPSAPATFIDNSTGVFRLTADAGHAFVIDPLGAAEDNGQANTLFPYGAAKPNVNPWTALSGNSFPIRRLTFANVSGFPMSTRVAASIFRLPDDVAVELPDQDDRPGIQRFATVDDNKPATPKRAWDDTPLARDYTGSYSWLATVLPVNAAARDGLQPANARHGSFLYEVSVAVFHKRDSPPSALTERAITAELLAGNNLEISGARDVVDEASQDIRAGQWIALAGVHPTTGQFLLKWYRLLSFDDESREVNGRAGGRVFIRGAMLDGPQWPTPPGPAGGPTPTATNLRAILLPSVIGVATQTVKLEVN